MSIRRPDLRRPDERGSRPSLPDSERKTALQRRLRFLMRFYIGCWIGVYILFKQNTFVTTAYVRCLEILPRTGFLSPLTFIWSTATAVALLGGAVFWWATREVDDGVEVQALSMDPRDGDHGAT